MDNYTVYTYVNKPESMTLVIEPDGNEVIFKFCDESSNNDRLSLRSVIEGLQYVQYKSDLARVTVYTDSKYVKTGDEHIATENIDLWRQLTRLEDSIGLVIQWIFKKPPKKIMTVKEEV